MASNMDFPIPVNSEGDLFAKPSKGLEAGSGVPAPLSSPAAGLGTTGVETCLESIFRKAYPKAVYSQKPISFLPYCFTL